jgi:two-component system sensor histidine kinase SenX3
VIGWVVAAVAVGCAAWAVAALVLERRRGASAAVGVALAAPTPVPIGEIDLAGVGSVGADSGPEATSSPELGSAVTGAAVSESRDSSDRPPELSTADAELLVRLRMAVDRLEHGVVIWDGASEIYRNQAASTLAEARDSHVLVAAALEELLAEAASGRHVRRSVELFGPPAESFVVTASPISPGGGDGAIAVVEDRSLQRRTETVRRDFVANISHELKTPIGALGLLAETLRDEPDREIITRLASRMIVEADRLGRTVDDLLELSRIEFGDESEFATVAVLAVVAEAATRISSAAEQSGIELRIDVAEDVAVDGDQRQLVSAVFNLLDNAVKYSPVDSEVLVEALDDPEDGVVRLYVSDHGIGVPRRDLDRIFERFYRVDRARSRETGGTGLGLAIVRHVASNHGGDIQVESTEGVGSTFTLVLPRAEVNGAPVADEAIDGELPGELELIDTDVADIGRDRVEVET